MTHICKNKLILEFPTKMKTLRPKDMLVKLSADMTRVQTTKFPRRNFKSLLINE